MKVTPQLKYFVGKLVTIFLRPINRDFKEELPESYPKPLYRYFLGVVEHIDDQGLVIQQATNGLKAYYVWTNVVGIAEEEVLDPSNPEDAKKIEDFVDPEALRPKMPEIDIPEGPLDAEKLADVAKQLKEQYGD